MTRLGAGSASSQVQAREQTFRNDQRPFSGRSVWWSRANQAQRRSIAYFQQNAVVGGAEEYLFAVMAGVDRDRFSVSFICPEHGNLDGFAQRVIDLGVHVERFRIGMGYAGEVRAVHQIFRRVRADIAHFNDPCIAGIPAARLAGVPTLILTHHTPALVREYNWRGRLLEHVAFRCRPHAVFSSEHDRQAAIKKDRWKPDHTHVIHHGIDVSRFAPTMTRHEARATLGLRPDDFIVGTVARLVPQKAQMVLIEAARQLREEIPTLRLVFVGDGELRGALEATAREAGLQDRVTFAGAQRDVPSYLSAFDVFALPSDFEGCPVAIMEASSMRLPVVATAVNGVQEAVVHEVTGLLFPRRDTLALSHALRWMWQHPEQRQYMGEAGRALVLRRFTRERMVSAHWGMYDSLLEAARQ